jgi:VanZ family protein
MSAKFSRQAGMLLFIPSLFFTGLVTYLLVMPSSDMPENPFFEMIHLDKWVHIGLFALLVCFWAYPFLERKNKSRYFLYVTLACIAYGMAMEYIQLYFTTDRSFDVLDIVADVLGALLGHIGMRKFQQIQGIKKEAVKN